MSRSFKLLTGAMAVAAVVALAFVDWGTLAGLDFSAKEGLVAILLLSLLSERLALTFVVGQNASSASLTFILLLASICLFGPAGTVAVALLSGLFSQFLVQKKTPLKAIFNISQFVIVTALAGWTYSWLGGTSSVSQFVVRPLPFIAFGVSTGTMNLLAVSLGIAMIEKMPLRRVVRQLFGAWGANLGYDLLVSPVALLVVVLYIEFGIGGLVLAALTLFFIRRSYLTQYQLQEANRDLLKALVKAIETRDPYTSGHSLRVASLARRIAIQLGMSGAKVEAIETAALLHDIGKIDEVYVNILGKAGSLTLEERAIIQSHASKGAELLRTISSFSENIVLAVRHHHERVDGKGYPDRIAGAEIPIGARIIKVCDAIDAMLSDRPYRSALAVSEVRAQLVEYAGVQFDLEVVQVVITGEIVGTHSNEIVRSRSVPDIAWGPPKRTPGGRTNRRAST